MKLRWVLPVIAAALFSLSFVASAHADPATGSAPEVVIKWDGATHDMTASEDGADLVVRPVVVVPGDRHQRKATVINTGPTAAVATVQIINVTTSHPVGATNTDLEDHIHLFWDFNGFAGEEVWTKARLAKNLDGVSHSVSFLVKQGEEFKITAGFYFNIESKSGMAKGQSSVLSFEIRVLLEEATGYEAPTGGTINPAVLGFGSALMVLAGIACLLTAKMFKRRPL